MRWSILVAMLLGGAMSSHGAELDLSECQFPQAPMIPDGVTATEEELGVAGGAVREYVADGNAALECLQHVETSMGSKITEEQRGTIVTRYNTVVDEMNAVAERYNAQVRAYKSR